MAMPTIPQLISAINPDLYYDYGGDKSKLKKFKDLVKEKGPYGAVMNKLERGEDVGSQPVLLGDKGNELAAEHNLVYDSSSEALEAIYFFILDLMNDQGLKPEKLVDNFTATPGGAYFSEVGMKAQRMQEEASKMLANIGVVTRGVLNNLYDLKEFRIRLQNYDSLKSKDKNEKEAAILSLKQIWLDKVDLSQRGQGSIHAMSAGNLQYTTLRDAFLAAKDEKDVDKMDLNDRVKRVLKPRIQEFNFWIGHSESELRKRYEIQKNYLKSQVNNLKLYARWVKPYLQAASQLEMKEPGREPMLVNMFNTLRMQLTLLGKFELKVAEAALEGSLPLEFKKMAEKKVFKRKYYSCVLVDFTFRAIPRQGMFTGRTEVTFRGYALNEEELKKLNSEMDKSDLGALFKLIEGTAGQSLEAMEKEIEEFLEEDKKEKESESKDESNPFLALFGVYNKKSEKKGEKSEGKDGKKDDKEKPIAPDNWIEKNHLRKVAAKMAAERVFTLFDIYKKVHGMPSYT